MVTVRKMNPSEANAVKKMAKKAFKGIETFFVSTPKEAMVALIDSKIVGSILIKYIVSNGKKIGYFDVAFVDPEYQGQGIGGVLYEKTTSYLWEQGCTALVAIVKDDNVGSWKLFLNNGFSRTNLAEATRQLGLKTMVLQYFTTPLFISNGMEFYLAMKDTKVISKDSNSTKQICCYLLANLLLLLPALVNHKMDFPIFLCSYFTLLLGGVIFGYIGTLFSKNQWKFRLNNGGATIIAFINLIGAVYPMIGNWYPLKYENTIEFRRTMGITALCEWIFVIITTILAFALQQNYVFFKLLYSLGSVFLLYRILAIYPFESYGGGRVYRWNKRIYVALAIISVAIILLENI